MLRVRLASTLLLMLGATASAQDATPPAAPPAATPAADPSAATPVTDAPSPAPTAPTAPMRVTGRPATVNGQAITSDDVLLQLRLLGLDSQRLEPGVRDHIARRAVAEEMLLAGEAKRLAVDMPDRDVDAWWERRAGE